MPSLSRNDALAAEVSVACRYFDNGDNTITDTQTGLMWEKKNNITVTQTVSWTVALTEFLGAYNGTSTDGVNLGPGCSIYHDWRVPNAVELQTILLAPYPCATSPCIDPIFGDTAADNYWSSTTYADAPSDAWYVSFGNGRVGLDGKDYSGVYVRAVRGSL